MTGSSAREATLQQRTTSASGVGDYDLYLFNEGTHLRAYDVFGAHIVEANGVDGVRFAVWAPNARAVSVVGDFNSWDRDVHQMRCLGDSGVWEVFVPGIGAGEVYKYEIQTASNETLLKSDPYAFHAEVPPRSASIVAGSEVLSWRDAAWMERRPQRNWTEEAMAVYEVHLASWRVGDDGQPLNYRDLAHQLVDYVGELGFTHIELMPVAEHPFGGSWGYQVTGYYAPTARCGTPSDFAYFVDHCHRHGIGVILDWVPGHFPSDAHGLASFDGTSLYEHADARQGRHPDWDTLIFNFGRNEVRSFLLSNALFWFDRYHIDGIRVDAVASMLYVDYSRSHGEWIPNRYGGRENLEAVDFLKQLNIQVYGQFPGAMTIAEESTAWPGVSRPTHVGGLGFGFKWNMGWMNDVLRYMTKDPVHRKYHHSDLTFGMLYAYHENFILPLSHDEVVHGKRSLADKMPGDGWQKFANLRLLLAFMYGHPGKKLIFMGGEFGQWREWDCSGSLDWHLAQCDSHRGIQALVTDLNRLYRTEPALHHSDFDPAGFEWIDCQDMDVNVVTFARRGRTPDETFVFACNFSPIPRESYRVGMPCGGDFTEVLNTDAAAYGGSNMGNGGSVTADEEQWHGRDQSASIVLPPLAAIVLKPALGGGDS